MYILDSGKKTFHLKNKEKIISQYVIMTPWHHNTETH